eukprot:CAMPEP_0119326558 /NCGR_PEP_ID=MMETSP1333-20130426/68683_1 /TAXON_ID=418940 /ORGANISM="Scyphosphaera apsteinii, Strain RCC1455" /LENGTH=65 /DNA_ID=CAMNT_0007334893 /DNA_START=295 /DNA_END=492 /DNA_ORIENTATION=-
MHKPTPLHSELSGGTGPRFSLSCATASLRDSLALPASPHSTRWAEADEKEGVRARRLGAPVGEAG